MWNYLPLPVALAIWYLNRKKVELVDMPPINWPKEAAPILTTGEHPGVMVC